MDLPPNALPAVSARSKRKSAKENDGGLQIQAMYTPGVPHTTKKRRVFKTITAEEQAIASAAYQEKLSEKRENEKRMREEAERKREEDGVRSVLAAVQAAGFTSLFEFQKALHACKNQQISSQVTRNYLDDHAVLHTPPGFL